MSRELHFEAIGTKWHISIFEEIDDSAWSQLQKNIHDRIDEFDKAYSRFRDDSFVTQLSKQAGSYKLPTDGYELLSFYQQLYELTNGAVTPLIGRALSDIGYDKNYTFRPGSVKPPPRWEEVLEFDSSYITVHKSALLDFGAAGKGYLVDLLGIMLDDAHIGTFIINAGGDILHRTADSTLVEVGLENPHDVTEIIGIAGLGNGSLCASSGQKRAWNGYHHILDPHTGKPTDDILATWVLAESAMVADGMATALFFVEPAALSKVYDFSYVVLDKTGAVRRNKDCPVLLFEEVKV